MPPAAAEAIASVIGRALLLARADESFMLWNDPICVHMITVALSVQQYVDPGGGVKQRLQHPFSAVETPAKGSGSGCHQDG